MDINRDLVRQKFYELTGQGTYNVDLTIYKNVSNAYVVYLEEDENTIQLLPVGTYSIDEENSEIFLNYPQEEFKYFGILENIDKPTFNWLQLGALSELSAEQLNELNSNFEEFVNTVYETLQEYNPLRLTNSINKEKYVFPKLKVGDILIMGEDGLEPYEFLEIKLVYDDLVNNIDALEKWREYSEEVMEIMENYELGNPSQLLTEDKSSFANAINELIVRIENKQNPSFYNIDGGTADVVYTLEQYIEGGNA